LYVEDVRDDAKESKYLKRNKRGVNWPGNVCAEKAYHDDDEGDEVATDNTATAWERQSKTMRAKSGHKPAAA
jgi:hypothetical protein